MPRRPRLLTAFLIGAAVNFAVTGCLLFVRVGGTPAWADAGMMLVTFFFGTIPGLLAGVVYLSERPEPIPEDEAND